MYFMLLDYLIFLSLVCIALSLLTYMPLIVALSPRCIVLRLPELFTSLSNCCFSLMIVYRCLGVEFVGLVWFGLVSKRCTIYHSLNSQCFSGLNVPNMSKLGIMKEIQLNVTRPVAVPSLCVFSI